ncbi:MAG: DUF1573 domain-containing protein [Spirochaetales bacterium]|nr:DUF1573 domain-containing protein [Spirochaetales bacterium]
MLFGVAAIFSDIVLSDNTFDFGTVRRNNTVQGMFYVMSNDFTRVQLQTGCDCLSISQTESNISPNNPLEIRWTLDTHDYNGSIEKDILILSGTQTLCYAIVGTVGKNTAKRTKVTPTELYNFTDDMTLLNGENVLGYFSYHTCHNCAKIAKKLHFDAAAHGMTMYYYDLDIPQNRQNLYNLTQQFGTMPALPFVIVGEQHYFGAKEIDAYLSHSKIPQNMAKRNTTDKLSIMAIIISGLLDGINPCAFTVIILLISYLSLQLRSRRSILITGIVYTAAVFITYYLVGLGLLSFLRQLTAYTVISLILRWSITIVLFILALLSLIDFILIRSGRKNEMLLKLPHTLQNIIRRNIRQQTKNYKIFGGALTLGILVSVFELACTGQVYFPIIGYMVNTVGQRSFGMLLLLIYNIGFIIPLLIVFILVYAGVSSKKMGDFFGKHLAAVKLMFFVLFVVFAIINIL